LACTWLIWKVSVFPRRIRSWPFHSSTGPCSIIILGWRLLGSTWLIRHWRPWWHRWLLPIRRSSCHRQPWRRCFRHWRLRLIHLSRRSELQRRLSHLELQPKILGRILIELQWRPFWLISCSRWIRISRYRRRLSLRSLRDRRLLISCCFTYRLIIRSISRWSSWWSLQTSIRPGCWLTCWSGPNSRERIRMGGLPIERRRSLIWWHWRWPIIRRWIKEW
jgi:hypothetical protein